MKKYLTLLLAAAAVLSCQPKANFLLDNCPEIHDLESGALLSPRQARKAPGCYGVVHTRLFDSQQTISFVRYRPESFSTTIVTAEREDADSTSALCLASGALAGINGSYFNVNELITTCFIKDDGQIIGETSPSEYFRTNGVITFSETDFSIDPCDTAAVYAGADASWEVMASGPILIDEGERITYTDSTVVSGWKRFYARRHPRTLVGREADGTTWLVVVDGRVKDQAEGMSIEELTVLGEMMSWRDAINLDGGGSSTLWTLHGDVLNNPVDNHRYDSDGERIVPNILTVSAL